MRKAQAAVIPGGHGAKIYLRIRDEQIAVRIDDHLLSLACRAARTPWADPNAVTSTAAGPLDEQPVGDVEEQLLEQSQTHGVNLRRGNVDAEEQMVPAESPGTSDRLADTGVRDISHHEGPRVLTSGSLCRPADRAARST
jgi:hypothetical protein